MEPQRALRVTGPALRRAFDAACASAGLAFLAPLFALIAIAIKLDSTGPVFFIQERM